MRKIISKAKEGRKKKMKQFAVSGILIVILFLSVFGYSSIKDSQGDNEKITYNGIEFTKESGLWNAEIGNSIFYFKYNPQEIEMIDSQLNSLNNYYGKPLYIYSENSEAETEIYRNLFYYNQIVQRVQDACLEEDKAKCGENVPIKNCENNFIIIKESNNTGITQQENCVFIEGNEDLIKITDEFLFKMMGISQ